MFRLIGGDGVEIVGGLLLCLNDLLCFRLFSNLCHGFLVDSHLAFHIVIASMVCVGLIADTIIRRADRARSLTLALLTGFIQCSTEAFKGLILL